MPSTLKDLGLDSNSNNELYQTYLEALNSFVLPLTKTNISGIILCGSFAKGKLQFGSDIDLVIIDNSIPKTKMEDFTLNGIKITVISYSKEALLKELESENSKFVRRISHLLSSGIALHSKEDCEELIAKASLILKNDLPELTGQDLDTITEFIKKHEELAADYFKRYNDLAFFTRFSFAVQEAIQNYFKLNRQIIPNWKWTAEDIKDKEFLEALLNFYSGSTKEVKHQNFAIILKKLKEIVANYIS